MLPPSAAGAFLWSDGSNFNGFIVLMMVIPTSSGTAWPGIFIDPNSPRQVIPDRTVFPISDGLPNNQISAYWNSSIDPPNTAYAVFGYDSAMKQVYAPTTSADFITITAATFVSPWTPPTPPIAGVVIPTP